MSDTGIILSELRELRTAVSALTAGLVIQQEAIFAMDEKMTQLLEAATQEGGNELAEALQAMAAKLDTLAAGQQTILARLPPPKQ